MRRGTLTTVVLALALATIACVTTGPLPLSAPPSTTAGVTDWSAYPEAEAPERDGSVHSRRNEQREAREVRWLDRVSPDGNTGYKEHLVEWRGPGTTARKVVLPYPLRVHDAHYLWTVTGILGAPYQSRWGGVCWNFKYETRREDQVRVRAMAVHYAFACQHRDGRWYAFKNRAESPARDGAPGRGNLQRLIQQMLR